MTSETYAIVVDSTSDIPVDLKKNYDIFEIPARIIVDDKEIIDRVEIPRSELISLLLNTKKRITTSQAPTGDFYNTFNMALEKYDRVLFIGVSGSLSGTLQNAMLAAKMIGNEKVLCVDSESVSYGITLLAKYAALRRKMGMELKALIKELEEVKKSIRIYFFVESLDYLHRGGRIGFAKTLLGKMLDIKPILTLENGLICPFKSVRGLETGYNSLKDLIKEQSKEYTNYVFVAAYGLENTLFNNVLEQMKEEFLEDKEFMFEEIGSIILCHVGPGVEAVGIMKLPENMDF